MTNTVECTGSDFTGIVNPYTGETMKVMMVVGCGPEPKYFVPDTYSTSDAVGDSKDGFRRWSMKGGVYGARETPSDGILRCAYTGDPLVPSSDGSFSGGFDPHAMMSRDEFLYYVTMRDGVPARPEPSFGSSRVTRPAEHVPMSLTHEPEYIDGALETAEVVLKKTGFKPQSRTVVSGFEGRKSKK